MAGLHLGTELKNYAEISLLANPIDLHDSKILLQLGKLVILRLSILIIQLNI